MRIKTLRFVRFVPGQRLAVSVLLALGITSGQEQTFSVDVNLVRVLATVKDSSGALVGGLKKEDFQIFDNGVPQELRLFEKRTEQPLSVALLVDTSGSTARELKYELDSVRRFLRSLFQEGNPLDALALFTFNWEVRRHTGYTRRLDRFETAMRNFKAEAGTSMYDALFLAADDLAARDGRHVMVVITDGGDTTSAKEYDDAVRALQNADTVLYPILVVPITNGAGRNTGGENALTTLAASTGGRVFAPSTGTQLDSTLDTIIQDLRTQYLLGYYPKDGSSSRNSFHRIQVRTAQPKLLVTTRSGYYATRR